MLQRSEGVVLAATSLVRYCLIAPTMQSWKYADLHIEVTCAAMLMTESIIVPGFLTEDPEPVTVTMVSFLLY